MTHDLIVIGAGPAGMSAALTAVGLGLKVALLDEQPRPGGQIYRNVTAAGPRLTALLGRSYSEGRHLTERLAGSLVAGRQTNRIFIETGRFHGEAIARALAARRAS